MTFRFAMRLAAMLLIGTLVTTTMALGEPPAPPATAPAEEAPPEDAAVPETLPDQSVEQLADSARQSVVIIRFTGRDGQREGLGTGFVVEAGGLIATNLHVIGEARPISVELADGRRLEVTSVHATDRTYDLALIKVDAHDLPVLKLAGGEPIKQGRPVVAVGNPLGLAHSVVAGVVSGEREMDGRNWIQLAIPIEPGNSGGPLLDMQGRVLGLLTMKSLVTANLGFAVPVKYLRALLEKPNPIPIERWLTIGALDQKHWKSLFGARWRQRAGRIVVDGAGTGFGGRSICLWQPQPPQAPFEVAVSVRLDDEAGAAGLVFGSDGADKHFGFYPSAGGLRLSRFDGPDVTSWQVLSETKSPHYRPGDWNTLRVRIEADKLMCFVNEQLVVESPQSIGPGQVGLAKFRQTKAEFRRFQMAPQVASDRPTAELAEKVTGLISQVKDGAPFDKLLLAELSGDARGSMAILREHADQLQNQAVQLRLLAQAVHQERVLADLGRALEAPEEEIDLFHAALLMAQLDNDEIDIDAYRAELTRMADEIAKDLPLEADDAARLVALNQYLFEVNGFHGSRADYYSRSNSYVNEVLDDREGLPITLSLIYMELGRRIGLSIVGIGLPGHFVVRHEPAEGEGQLIDVFEAAAPLSIEEAKARVALAGLSWKDDYLKPVAKRDMLVRMLHNLRGAAGGSEDAVALLRYLDAILSISPDSAEDRWLRAVFRYQTGQGPQALEDLDWLADHAPEGVDLGRVGELRDLIERADPQNR